jgi:Ca2+-binding EF-hand superfamily protein
VKETITRVTKSTADIFGVSTSDAKVFGAGGQERQNFGTDFARSMDGHLKRTIDKMTDDAFRHARDGYEGGGNLSLPDFERWAADQPTLISWYENLGDHWLAAIHSSSRSPVQNYRSQRQIGLRRAFQEMDLAGMLRDAQRRQGNWYDMDKRDFEQMMRQHVRTPSMGVVDKLYAAFDIEDRGRVDGREVLAGMCCLAVGSKGGQSDRQQLRIIFEMFDKERNGTINRQDLATCFRSFFMLAYDVVHHSLLNCSELFGAADDFVNACWDQVNKQTEQVLERSIDTIFRSAAGSKGSFNWSDFERWESRDNSLVSWMAKVADMWCTAIADDDALFPQLEEDSRRNPDRYPEESRPYPNKEYDDYYDHYDNVQRGYGKKKKNKYRPPYFLSGPLAPVPGGLGAMGYPYQSYLKKIFSITLISHRTNHKKFTYRNPYAKRTCFSLHSSNPNIIEIKQPQLVIPPNTEKFARLTFHPAR